MKTIDTDFVRQKWTCRPELSTATASISTAVNADIYDTLATEVSRRLDRIYMDHEVNRMNGVNFNDLEKDLKELGIVLSTIRRSSGEVGCEIEGYFDPSMYKKHNTREDGKWLDLVPEKVKFSGPATIIFWKDGTKTVVKCQEEDEYFDEEKGIAMCYLKKLFGNKGNYNNIFRKAMKVSEVR